jgi:DNA-binding NtrC family response regulator
VNLRIVAATNRDLENDTAFRRDLYFRLNVARIHLPPLRERKEDIPALADAFRVEFGGKFGHPTTGFSRAAEAMMLAYDWPGNIRELHNIIEAAFIELSGSSATVVELPAPFRRVLERRADTPPSEVHQILSALWETKWNKSKAADRLQWSRMTLYRKMAQYKISEASHRAS